MQLTVKPARSVAFRYPIPPCRCARPAPSHASNQAQPRHWPGHRRRPAIRWFRWKVHDQNS